MNSQSNPKYLNYLFRKIPRLVFQHYLFLINLKLFLMVFFLKVYSHFFLLKNFVF